MTAHTQRTNIPVLRDVEPPTETELDKAEATIRRVFRATFFCEPTDAEFVRDAARRLVEEDEHAKFGPAAARLCFALSMADHYDVLVDQSKVRLGYPAEAQELAERAYNKVTEGALSGSPDSWRDAWRDAGILLAKGGAL